MVIPARRQVGNTVKKSEQPKLRVAAYCRVSTDSDEQETSYDAQVTHYTEYIQKNPEWELAGIFADDGISGTNTKKRTEFKRMIDECMAGNIDMIITKSISRFARNTLDCLQYIRQLKDKNIPVYFEKESINTMDAKGEVLITIMASLAQQESQSLSQNVKLGLQYRYQQGKVQVNYNRFLGYTKDKDGHLVIDPEQAEIVKRIYREYLEGSSMDKIAAGLMADGILTGAGKDKMAHQHHQQDSPQREVHGRRAASKDLYHRLPYQRSGSRTTAPSLNTTLRAIMKQSFRKSSSCRCRRSLSVAG
jgi:DNA invertase Pin-like site-specific DNA recombinase